MSAASAKAWYKTHRYRLSAEHRQRYREDADWAEKRRAQARAYYWEVKKPGQLHQS